MEMVFAALGQDKNYLEVPDAQYPPQPEARPWVLCIDDDSDFSFGLKLRLEQQGVDVLRAFAGMEGYRYAFTSPAQAIILDYEMPDGNGDYVLGRLKENPVTKDIPVIVLTGHRDHALERKMYNLGAVAYLTKPVDWEVLWSELRQHLEACPTLAC
jgi:DNA-binding response OmpR family regulator